RAHTFICTASPLSRLCRSSAQVRALSVQLGVARAQAERLSAERDKLLDLSNELRADLNRLASHEPAAPPSAHVRADDEGHARGHGRTEPADRVGALEVAVAALAEQNSQLVLELAPLRARGREVTHAARSGQPSGGLSSTALFGAEPLESVRASATSVGSSNRSADGRGARARLAETRISLAGNSTQLAGRPGPNSASERETASQHSARERERQRQRAEAARKRSLVPNYNRLLASEHELETDSQSPPRR
ncbi:hypothetical protein T492DRAFT_891101, partial [Pavlovales sp. CCMP2436]